MAQLPLLPSPSLAQLLSSKKLEVLQARGPGTEEQLPGKLRLMANLARNFEDEHQFNALGMHEEEAETGAPSLFKCAPIPTTRQFLT